MDALDFNSQNFREKSKRRKNRFFWIAGFAVIGYITFNTGLLHREFQTEEKSNKTSQLEPIWIKNFAGLLFFNQNQAREVDKNYLMPDKEADRLDILILGIRGENDEDAELAGALLTDTIMVFSHDKTTKNSSLVSIPRDLYVKIYNKNDKINAAYEYGLLRKEGTSYVKKLASQITGIYIDNVIVINFASFEKLIDQLGGVDVVLAKSFKEENQWGYTFELPAGDNHLDGKNALYYVRSRYSTNDFDRAYRQQQVLFAMKNKITKLNFISDPIKTLSVVGTLGQNIETDINIWNIKEIIDLGKEVDTSPPKFKKEVLSTDNLLYQTTKPNGEYILLPIGENFDQIKQRFKDILK
ncbi:MAG: LCP family protein [Candidatus Portnoybacteria bacterium]|nr:LCP family protein [Candidatus Portnoybacteria bacterium]